MREVRIKDICDKGSSNLKQKDVENKDGKYPVYGASGLIGKMDAYHQEKEYIAIVKDGSGIGRVTFLPAKSSVIGTLQYILPKEGYNIKYLSYCLQSLDLSKYKQGAAIPHIYFRDYGEYVVKVEEDFSEQQRIVDFLDTQFEKIDALKAKAEQQLQAAKDLFQTALKDLMNPEEGWDKKTLGEVGTFSRGGNFTKADFVDTGIPCIHYGQIHMHFGVYTEKSLSYLPNDFKKVKYAESGDLIIAITSEDDEGSCKCTAWLGNEKVAVGGHIAVFHHQLDPLFMSYFFMSPSFQKAKLDYTHGFKVVEIKPSDIAKIPILYPTKEKQAIIVEKLKTIQQQIRELNSNFDQTITLCNDLKQALLKSIFE